MKGNTFLANHESNENIHRSEEEQINIPSVELGCNSIIYLHQELFFEPDLLVLRYLAVTPHWRNRCCMFGFPWRNLWRLIFFLRYWGLFSWMGITLWLFTCTGPVLEIKWSKDVEFELKVFSHYFRYNHPSFNFQILSIKATYCVSTISHYFWRYLLIFWNSYCSISSTYV